MNSVEKFYIAAISTAKFLGSERLKILLNIFGSAENIWKADSDSIKAVRLPDSVKNSLIDFKTENPDEPQKLMDYCHKNKIGLCSFVDDDFPPLLKEINSTPAVFYYYGKLQPSAVRLAIVGARDNTKYGERVALELSEELAGKYRITIVSGAARGIDTCAHTGSMKFGRTVAVIGCGIDHAFALPNNNLIRDIAENGVVLSIFNPNQIPTSATFIARNRIIAGLSKGMIVVEAAEIGGSMSAAKCALDCGRDLFAVPGNVYSDKSAGCNKLIRDGAVLVRNADDIFDFYLSKENGTSND